MTRNWLARKLFTTVMHNRQVSCPSAQIYELNQRTFWLSEAYVAMLSNIQHVQPKQLASTGGCGVD